MINNLTIFNYNIYPTSSKEAEKLCSDKDFDTLIYISKIGNIMRRGQSGVWMIGIPNNINTIYLAVRYELLHKRKVTFYSSNLNYDIEILNYIKENLDLHSKLKFSCFENTRFLCHSTDIKSFLSIINYEEILSFNSLLKKNIPINSLRFKLKEPIDYLDYVDLCDWCSLSSERVVASREKNSINMDDDTEYTPAVRMYFETKKLYDLDLLSNDRHAKVLNSLPLNCVSYIVIHNRSKFEEQSKNLEIKKDYLNKFIFIEPRNNWTLKSFVNTANNLIKNQHN